MAPLNTPYLREDEFEHIWTAFTGNYLTGIGILKNTSLPCKK